MKETAEAALSANDCGIAVVLRGEIDHHTAAGIRESIDTWLYLYRPRNLTIDLSAVDFMDSSGLGLILGRVAVAEKTGTAVILQNVPPRVWKILDMAGVSRVPGLTVSTGKEKSPCNP